jgi:hypothetical protein
VTRVLSGSRADATASRPNLGSIELPYRAQTPAVATAVREFVAWLARFGEVSYDHQSYYAGPIGGRAKSLYYRRPIVGLVAVAPMVLSEALAPSFRKLFWKPQRFPIADAHYAMGFASLAHSTYASGDEIGRAHGFLNALESTRCPGYPNHAWGYPFDWVTRTGVMKADTPLITTTPYCYEAFEAVHEHDRNPHWREVMASIAEHAFADFHDRVVGEEVASAGYNPFDREGGVVNASAYRASLLTSAARRFDREDYAVAAARNLAFVLRSQQPDGSWWYAMDGVRDFVDHFHTCFVLKALAKIEAQTGDARCTAAIEAGVRYYVKSLFDEKGLPKPFAAAPRLTVYRHELYDYAECLNLGLLLRGRFADLDERSDATLDDVIARWRQRDGSFRARELRLGWDNVPMHRWAQSQMFRALARILAVAAPAGKAASRGEHASAESRESAAMRPVP